MSFWKCKVLPKIKGVFSKGKRKSASEVCKSFDNNKESLEKEIEDSAPDVQPKVVEIYRSSTAITQRLFKEPNESAVKENPDVALNVLQELANAGFPGAQMLSVAGMKCGAALISGPIVFLLQKTSTFLVDEEPRKMQEETREIAAANEDSLADSSVDKQAEQMIKPEAVVATSDEALVDESSAAPDASSSVNAEEKVDVAADISAPEHPPE